MTLHIENAATEAKVHALAERLGTDPSAVVDALVLDAYEALETAGSYAQRRNARVRLNVLLDRIDRSGATSRPADAEPTGA